MLAPAAYTVITGDELLVGRGTGALLLSLDFAVLVLAWSTLWYFAWLATKVLNGFDPCP